MCLGFDYVDVIQLFFSPYLPEPSPLFRKTLTFATLFPTLWQSGYLGPQWSWECIFVGGLFPNQLGTPTTWMRKDKHFPLRSSGAPGEAVTLKNIYS